MSCETMNESRFVPDFYLLAPHGVGALSFWYYLCWLGCPASLYPGVYKDGKIDPLKFPVPKTPVSYARGITVERFFLGKRLEYHAPKAIQLIRDPVDQITTVLNAGIANLVNGKRNANMQSLSPSTRLGHILVVFQMSLAFSSMRRCIQAPDSCLFIDTSDIQAENCADTLHRVAEYLGGRWHPALDAICRTPYNTFSSRRLWTWQPPKSFRSGFLARSIQNISIFPTKIHDFCANTWAPARVLDVFTHNGEEYTLSVPAQDFHEEGYLPEELAWTEARRDCARIMIDIMAARQEAEERVYRQYAMTPDDTIALIRSNPRFHTRFMRMMEHEISLPLREVPEKVERWTHFHAL